MFLAKTGDRDTQGKGKTASGTGLQHRPSSRVRRTACSSFLRRL